MLSCLFPAIGPELRSISPRPPSLPVPANGVSNPSRFRRYFDPSSIQGPVGEEAVKAGLSEVLDDRPGYAWNMMAFYDVEQAVPKLRKLAPTDAQSAERLLPALVTLMPRTLDGVDELPTAMPNLFGWMIELAELLDAEDPAGCLRSMAEGVETGSVSGEG